MDDGAACNAGVVFDADAVKIGRWRICDIKCWLLPQSVELTLKTAVAMAVYGRIPALKLSLAVPSYSFRR